MRKKGKLLTSFMRRVPARRHSLVLHRYPSGNAKASATVWTLNSDDKVGKSRHHSFLTHPTVGSLNAAAKISAESAYQSHGAVVVGIAVTTAEGALVTVTG